VKISIWWVVLLLAIILPIQQCWEHRIIANGQKIVFLAPGGRSLTATSITAGFETGNLMIEIHDPGGPMKQEIFVTDDAGGVAIWAARDDAGKQWQLLSCGIGVTETIQTIAIEADTWVKTSPKAILDESIQRWFGPQKSPVAWFCDSRGREVLHGQLKARGGRIEIPFSGGSGGSR